MELKIESDVCLKLELYSKFALSFRFFDRLYKYDSMPKDEPKTDDDNLLPFKAKLVKAQADLITFAHKLTSDKEEVNDLVQETLLKALDNEDKFLPGTNLLNWAYTIMKNIYVNKCRKIQQDKSFLNNVGEMATDDDQDSSRYSEYNYDIQEIYRLLNSLSDEYKVSFMMYISGFKYKEIAEKLNLPLGTVKSHIYLTRQKLLNIFKDLN